MLIWDCLLPDRIRVGCVLFAFGCFIVFIFDCLQIFMETNELRLHAMNLETPVGVQSFCVFNNTNCAKGFIYFTEEKIMRVCTLDTRFDVSIYIFYKHIVIIVFISI
jgi:hypothetical protein